VSFIDEYKRLEKLCNDAYNEPHGVSAYIEQMLNISDGEQYVSSWRDDLKMLKHCRWVRNKIVHEVEHTEANTCDEGDKDWIIGFRNRMLSGKDPLALYKKAKASRPKTKIDHEFIQDYNDRIARGGEDMDFIVFISIVFVAVAVMLFAIYVIK
jgi:hypothetical protein